MYLRINVHSTPLGKGNESSPFVVGRLRGRKLLPATSANVADSVLVLCVCVGTRAQMAKKMMSSVDTDNSSTVRYVKTQIIQRLKLDP